MAQPRTVEKGLAFARDLREAEEAVLTLMLEPFETYDPSRAALWRAQMRDALEKHEALWNEL